MKLNTVKSLLVAGLSLITFTATNAQTIPDIKIRNAYAMTRIYKTGKINQITPETKYEIVRPDIVFKDRMLNFAAPDIYFNSDGKRAKKKDTADITFNMITPGAIDLQGSAPRYSRGEDDFHSGYTMAFTYHFPLKIEVRNKVGQLQQTIVVIDEKETFEEVYHAAFFQAAPGLGAFKEIDWSRFHESDSCYNSSVRLRAEITQRMTMNRWSNMVSVLSRILISGYGSEKILPSSYNIYTIKDPKPEDAPLLALCDRTQAAIVNIGDKEKQAASIADLILLQGEFEKRLKEELPKNMKSLCYYNAAVCALFNGQTETSLDYYYQSQNRSRPETMVHKSLRNLSNIPPESTTDGYWSLIVGLSFYGQIPDPKAQTIVMKNYLQKAE